MKQRETGRRPASENCKGPGPEGTVAAAQSGSGVHVRRFGPLVKEEKRGRREGKKKRDLTDPAERLERGKSTESKGLSIQPSQVVGSAAVSLCALCMACVLPSSSLGRMGWPRARPRARAGKIEAGEDRGGRASSAEQEGIADGPCLNRLASHGTEHRG